MSNQIQYAFSQLREVDTILMDIRRLDASLSESECSESVRSGCRYGYHRSITSPDSRNNHYPWTG